LWAVRISYVGELGWELYIPTEFAAGVYDALAEAGAELGAGDGGYYAIDAMRIEKGYRAWGAELTPDETPVHAGMTFAVKPDKGVDFLGRDAVLRAMESGVTRRLVQFVIDDPDAMFWGGEPILRDGERVGELSSAGVAQATGATVAMGYVESPEPLRGRGPWRDYIDAGAFQVLLAGARIPAMASLSAAFDPQNARLKG
jgi:4-methylaminobutanoate oxidase (formaldehyde-forming)